MNDNEKASRRVRLASVAAGILTLAATAVVALAADTTPQQQAASPAQSPCRGEEFRQFDFWLGDWQVTNAAGAVAGHNTITARQQDCVLIEEWRSARGDTGFSMNHYDPGSRQWRQHWVGAGVVLEMSGGLKGNVMVLEGPMYYLRDQRKTRLRGEWTPLPDGRVRQHFLESADGGKSWTEWFDGYYKKVR